LLLARINVFIPHQEWFFPDSISVLKSFDAIFCLTRYAEKLFAPLHDNVTYIGFRGQDQQLPDIEKRFDTFLHMAGLSPYKATHALIRLWEQHPEWPLLTVIQHPERGIETTAANI